MASPATPASPYAQPQDMSTFRNVDASGNPVNPMQVPNQYANTIGSPNPMMTTDAMNIGSPSGKGAAAGGSQGKGAASGGAVEHGGEFNPNMQIENTYHPNAGPQGPKAYF